MLVTLIRVGKYGIISLLKTIINLKYTIMKKMKKIFEYMTTQNKYVFINNDFGWEADKIDIEGFEYVPSREGNALKAISSEELFDPQYATIRRGTHLQAQLRTMGETTKIDETINLSELSDKEIVVITSNEALSAIAPICDNKLDLAKFILSVSEYAGEDSYKQMDLRQSIALAKFLYKNNPHKVASLMDDI